MARKIQHVRIGHRVEIGGEYATVTKIGRKLVEVVLDGFGDTLKVDPLSSTVRWAA